MKVVITGRDFSTYNQEAINMLKNEGLEVIDYSDRNFGSGTSEEEVLEVISDADIAICGLEPYSQYVLKNCLNLKMISRRGIGYDNIDIKTCKKLGITVSRTVGAVESSVSEAVMAYILYFARRIDLQNQYMQDHMWKRIMTMGAKSRVLGLVGFGGIGKEIAKKANAFGMKVVYYCRHPQKEWDNEYHVSYLPMEELLKISDFISINVPLNETTRNMFNLKTLSLMKKGSYLINIARGAIVNEKDLRELLLNHHIAGAAIDVYDKEPCIDSLLVGLDNVILTPHTAPYTSENFIQMNNIASQNIIDYIHHELKDIHHLV